MDEKKEWYVVNTYAGHENRVKENLEKRIQTMGLQDYLFKIVVAEETEEDYDAKGKKKEVTRNIFPGYLFVQMIMTDDAWYVVRNTPGVTGFIGSSGGGAKPFSVPEEEIEVILRKIGQSEKKIVATFAVGDRVKVLNGPFANVEGTVDSMDDDAETASVLLIMFGRETQTELKYEDLEKVED